MSTLRPFLSFYGSKWRAAKRYPAPAHDTIIEPFAGSAGYSIRHAYRRIILVEKDPVIAATWRYLIGVSEDEILGLPDIGPGQTIDDLDIPQEARWLMGWWVNSAVSSPCKMPSAWMRKFLRGETSGAFWSRKIRARIARQLHAIRHWTVIEGDYSDAPDLEATWFIDPPYQRMGRHYRFGSNLLDFAALGEWCRGRKGQVIVCENEGADWLPFRYFMDIPGPIRRKSREVIWTNDPGENPPGR